MSPRRELHFEWDGAKALSNEHGVAFTLAMTIFRDPRIQTMFDDEHSDTEERWIAQGIASNGVPLVVVHTWKEMDATMLKCELSRRAGRVQPKGLPIEERR